MSFSVPKLPDASRVAPGYGARLFNQKASDMLLVADAKLPESLRFEAFPMRRLPAGIPAEFQPAFRVLFEMYQDRGRKKLQVREQVATLVANRVHAQVLASRGKLQDLEQLKKEALVHVLQRFMQEVYGHEALPIRDAFITLLEMQSHLIEHGPFIDIAFREGHSMGDKQTHGVYVHILDFFEWWLLCQEDPAARSTHFPRLSQYLGAVSLYPSVPIFNEKIAELENERDSRQTSRERKREILGELAALQTELQETLHMIDRVRSDIPELRELDWEGTGFTKGTILWDPKFDFQNMANENFEGFEQLLRERGLAPDQSLAGSYNVTPNPFHAGRKAVHGPLFPNLGWE